MITIPMSKYNAMKKRIIELEKLVSKKRGVKVLEVMPVSRECKYCGKTKLLEKFKAVARCKFGRSHKCYDCCYRDLMISQNKNIGVN